MGMLNVMTTHFENFDEQTGIELATLLAGITIVDPIWDRKVSGVTLDSRKVNSGDLFVACVGTEHDARHFISDAIQRGAIAVIAEAE